MLKHFLLFFGLVGYLTLSAQDFGVHHTQIPGTYEGSSYHLRVFAQSDSTLTLFNQWTRILVDKEGVQSIEPSPNPEIGYPSQIFYKSASKEVGIVLKDVSKYAIYHWEDDVLRFYPVDSIVTESSGIRYQSALFYDDKVYLMIQYDYSVELHKVSLQTETSELLLKRAFSGASKIVRSSNTFHMVTRDSLISYCINADGINLQERYYQDLVNIYDCISCNENLVMYFYDHLTQTRQMGTLTNDFSLELLDISNLDFQNNQASFRLPVFIQRNEKMFVADYKRTSQLPGPSIIPDLMTLKSLDGEVDLELDISAGYFGQRSLGVIGDEIIVPGKETLISIDEEGNLKSNLFDPFPLAIRGLTDSQDTAYVWSKTRLSRFHKSFIEPIDLSHVLDTNIEEVRVHKQDAFILTEKGVLFSFNLSTKSRKDYPEISSAVDQIALHDSTGVIAAAAQGKVYFIQGNQVSELAIPTDLNARAILPIYETTDFALLSTDTTVLKIQFEQNNFSFRNTATNLDSILLKVPFWDIETKGVCINNKLIVPNPRRGELYKFNIESGELEKTIITELSWAYRALYTRNNFIVSSTERNSSSNWSIVVEKEGGSTKAFANIFGLGLNNTLKAGKKYAYAFNKTEALYFDLENPPQTAQTQQVNGLTLRLQSDGTLFADDTRYATREFEKMGLPIPEIDSFITYEFIRPILMGKYNEEYYGSSTFKGSFFVASNWTPGAIATNYEKQKNRKIWTVTQADIEKHLKNFTNPFIPIPEAIKTWPAHGDSSAGEASCLAPFVDQNQNGFYEPEFGDYPKIRGDVALYSISNADNPMTNRNKSGNGEVELHVMLYGYPNDETVRDVVFANLRYINRGDKTLDTRYGAALSPPMHKSCCDWTGSLSGVDTNANFIFHTFPDTTNVFYAHGKYQMTVGAGIKSLDKPLYSYINAIDIGVRRPPINDEEWFTKLSGKHQTNYWQTESSSGFDTSFPRTRFFRAGNPAENEGIYFEEDFYRRFFYGLKEDAFEPNETIEHNIAIMYDVGRKFPVFDALGNLFDKSEEVSNWYEAQNFESLQTTCELSGESFAEEELIEFQLFPNPTTNYVFVRGLTEATPYQVFDINGKLRHTGNLSTSNYFIDFSSYSTGTYFVRFTESAQGAKVVKY